MKCSRLELLKIVSRRNDVQDDRTIIQSANGFSSCVESV